MKKIKTTIITTTTDEYYNKYYLKFKAQVDSGEAKKKFFTNEDKQSGVVDLEVIFEEIPL